MGYGHASRSRLTKRDLPRFTGTTLFDGVARVLCEAECLPRKELFESWEVAKRAARKLRGKRVVDLCCGHALVGQLMLLLVPSLEEVLAIDKRLPQSATRVTAALAAKWPRLRDRVTLTEARLADVRVGADDVVVSCHGCGALTDRVLDLAIAARVPVAVLPCCQATATGDAGGLSGWLDPALAIDVTRAARLREHGFRVSTQRIPETVTAKNRLLVGQPLEGARLGAAAGGGVGAAKHREPGRGGVVLVPLVAFADELLVATVVDFLRLADRAQELSTRTRALLLTLLVAHLGLVDVLSP